LNDPVVGGDSGDAIDAWNLDRRVAALLAALDDGPDA
jgi:hypothetical protein